MALKSGSKGSEVKKMQEALKSAGYYKGAIDGSFGPQTLSAVKAFQKAKGLSVDGSFGPKTSAALYGGSSSSSSGKSAAEEALGPAPKAVTIDKFNPNIDKTKLLEDAKGTLKPVETEQRNAYNQQLTELSSAFEELKAQIQRDYGKADQNLADDRDVAREQNMDDAARRNLYWSTIPSINNQKIDDAYFKEKGKLEDSKAADETNVNRDYTTKKSTVESALSQLAALIEEKAAAMVPDLYNQEFSRQYQQTSLNADIDSKNWNNQMDLQKYNESVRQFEEQMRLQREQMAQQAQLAAMARRSSGGGGSSGGLTALQQLGLQDNIAGAKSALLGMMPSLGKTNSKTTATNWQDAYAKIQGQISTLPAYMQGDVNNWFQNTGWYGDYKKYGTYVAPTPAASGGGYDPGKTYNWNNWNIH